MIEILIRIQNACLELPTLTQLIAGAIATILGLLLWLAGIYYSTIIIGLLGAAFGAVTGLIISTYFNLSAILSVVIAATLLSFLAMYLQNIVVILLATTLFAFAGGTGYFSLSLADNGLKKALSHVQNKTYEDDLQQPETIPYEPETQLDNPENQDQNDSALENRSFIDMLKKLLADLWSSTSSNRGYLIMWALIGGIGGLLLACLIKRIVITLCYSFIGTTATIAGIQLLLLAKSVTIVSAFEDKPRVLSIIFTGMIVFGWAVQLFVAGPAKVKRTKISDKEGS